MEREEEYVCLECGKSCTDKGSLQVHMKVHSDERPHKCQECEKIFKSNTNLKNHMISHSDEKIMCVSFVQNH